MLQAVCGTPAPESLRRDQEAAVDRSVTRRVSGMPLAYASGTAGFRYLDLEVNEHVLIPRPETEGLVQVVLDWTRTRSEPLRGLEIGVGSGAVVLSLAREGTFEMLVGTDVSTGALAVAGRNVARTGAPEVRLVAGSLFDALRPGVRFDVIVSNPPYLTEGELADTEPSVHRYEPRVALVSSGNGMDHLVAICRGARCRLAPGGLLALEIDSRRGTESVAAARAAGLEDVRVSPDVFGRDRVLTATVAPR